MSSAGPATSISRVLPCCFQPLRVVFFVIQSLATYNLTAVALAADKNERRNVQHPESSCLGLWQR